MDKVDSSNDPVHLRLVARNNRLNNNEALAAKNEAKANRIEGEARKKQALFRTQLDSATYQPSAAAEAHAAGGARRASDTHQRASTFQRQIDEAFNKLTQIFADRDYKSKNENKVIESREELTKAIDLLKRWEDDRTLQQLGGHNWFHPHPSQKPETLAEQVQSLKDMVEYILEDEKLKFGGRRRKRKTRRRHRRRRRRTRRRRRKHSRHPKKRQASKTRKGRLDFVTHKGDKAYNRSGHRQYRRHRPYRRRTRRRRRR